MSPFFSELLGRNMPSKYNVSSNASKRTYEGIVYDSVLEMRFARDFIVPRVNSGTIISFDRQVKFELQPAFYYQGQRIRSIVYIADFVIQYSDGHVVVVDIKGMPDTAAKLKRKLFYYKFPDVDYKWVCYSRQDGGWIMYEELTKKRKERKKRKEKKKKLKESVLSE